MTEGFASTHFKGTFRASFKQESPRPKVQKSWRNLRLRLTRRTFGPTGSGEPLLVAPAVSRLRRVRPKVQGLFQPLPLLVPASWLLRVPVIRFLCLRKVYKGLERNPSIYTHVATQVPVEQFLISQKIL